MPGLKERAKTLVELFDAARFLWANRPLELNDQAKALLTPQAQVADRRAVAANCKPSTNLERPRR